MECTQEGGQQRCMDDSECGSATRPQRDAEVGSQLATTVLLRERPPLRSQRPQLLQRLTDDSRHDASNLLSQLEQMGYGRWVNQLVCNALLRKQDDAV